jgi:hypothetical protein
MKYRYDTMHTAWTHRHLVLAVRRHKWVLVICKYVNQFSIHPAMKAQMGSRGIALLFL